MRSRRALIYILAGVVIGLGALSAAQRDEQQATSTLTTTTAPGATTDRQQTARPEPELAGTLPADKVVKGRVGETVTFRVRSESPDIARIAPLGVEGSVGPDISGLLSFEADQPGRFPVVLTVSGRRVGSVEVAPAR